MRCGDPPCFPGGQIGLIALERRVMQIEDAMRATFATAIARFWRNGRQRFRLGEGLFVSNAPATAHGIMGH